MWKSLRSPKAHFCLLTILGDEVRRRFKRAYEYNGSKVSGLCLRMSQEGNCQQPVPTLNSRSELFILQECPFSILAFIYQTHSLAESLHP